jgi:hypothetical protein
MQFYTPVLTYSGSGRTLSLSCSGFYFSNLQHAAIYRINFVLLTTGREEGTVMSAGGVVVGTMLTLWIGLAGTESCPSTNRASRSVSIINTFTPQLSFHYPSHIFCCKKKYKSKVLTLCSFKNNHSFKLFSSSTIPFLAQTAFALLQSILMCTVQLHTFKITADEYIRMFIFSDTDILILKCLQLLPPLESCTGTFY